MTDIDLTAAIEAVKDVDQCAECPTGCMSCHNNAEAAVAAALPHIREALAQQIDAAERLYVSNHTPPSAGAVAFVTGVRHVTRIVRGAAS